MIGPWWSVGAWLGAVSGLGAIVWVSAVPIGESLKPSISHARAPVVPVRPYAGDSLLSAAARRDVFRASRRPSPVAYDPTRAVAPELPPVPKPVLVLVGTVVGVPASALVEGFPGIEGSRVVRIGDVVAGLRTVRIGRDSVVIAGLDTVWVLRVRQPWQ